MIVSFHPLYVADKNIICAGRAPDVDDERAAAAAEAVILPQGCRRDLYGLARQHCRLVFPNYDARFAYEGKTGQIALFKRYGAPHPETMVFSDTDHFERHVKRIPEDLPFGLPCVFKFDWGGGGDTVYPVVTEDGLMRLIDSAVAFERSGLKGFLIQEMIAAGSRSLRVVVIGNQYRSYWRVQPKRNGFWTGLTHGARIDTETDPGLQARAVRSVKRFCRSSGVNLAGFDILFTENSRAPKLYYLEINYFFGRRGLGGSNAYYRLLLAEIESWLGENGLMPGRNRID